jgi:hypothetical protein
MDKIRLGNFTSSEIGNLMKEGKAKGSFGEKALTYIEHKNIERRLGRSLNSESNARPLVWGKMLEGRVFELLGLEYSLCSQETLKHPKFDYWYGSPDGKRHDENKAVIDIKCPYTLLSFVQLVECKNIQELIDNHKDGEKYFWQLVSNAILTDSDFAELIVYAPYESELEDIRVMCEGNPQAYWVMGSQNEELPFLPDGGHYKNINILRFEVKQEYKDHLTNRVKEAAKLLVTPELVTV